MTEIPEGLVRAVGERYLVEGEVGRGGMATVYRARDRKHGRTVGIKVLREDLAAALGPERFLREIEIASGLNHPHILPLHDSGTAEGLLYYVMPFVEGESLRDRLDREGRLPVGDAVRIARQVADALAFAHARGIIHRDIKPENILLQAGHAVVADFGLARAVDAAAGAGRVTQTGTALGTPSYMSPEQIEGRDDIDGRSDVYSLACMVFEMVAGRQPFARSSLSATLAAHLTGPTPRLADTVAGVPAGLDDALARAMAKRPMDRFQGAAAFGAALAGQETAPVLARSPRRKRWAALAVMLAVGLGVTAVALQRRSTASLSSTTVAVLPFGGGGSDSLGLREGMVSLLATKLDGAGDIRSVDPRALLSHITRAGRRPLGPEDGNRIAQQFGAGHFVLGEVLDVGGRLSLSASLYRTGRDREAVATATVIGTPEEVFDMVDRVTAQLLGGWGGPTSTRVDRIAAVTTHSLPALKAYLEGEAALRSGGFDRAARAFQRALAADSLFALAWYRLSTTAFWLTRNVLAIEAAERAAMLTGRLPEREALVLQALRSFLRSDADQTEQQLRAILGTYPDDVEGWFLLGELTFHVGPWQGRDLAESREAWVRVGTLEPNEVSAMIHLARLAAVAEDARALDSLTRRLAEVRGRIPERSDETRAEEVELAALRAFRFGNASDRERTMAELGQATDITILLAAWAVAIFGDDPDGGAQVVGLLTGPTHSATARAIGHLVAAHLVAARGRWAQATEHLAAARRIDPVAGTQYGTLLGLAPFRPSTAAERAVWRAQVRGLLPPERGPSPSSSTFFSAHVGLHAAVQHYLLGLLASADGDRRAALAEVEALLGLEGSTDVRRAAANLARGVRADLAWRRGDAAATLDEVEGMVLGSYLLATASPVLSGSRERYLRAWALDRLGRGGDAARWFGSFEHFSLYEVVFAPTAHVRAAEILERMGRREEAAARYERALRWLAEADPELTPEIQRIEARLAALRGGS